MVRGDLSGMCCSPASIVKKVRLDPGRGEINQNYFYVWPGGSGVPVGLLWRLMSNDSDSYSFLFPMQRKATLCLQDLTAEVTEAIELVEEKLNNHKNITQQTKQHLFQRLHAMTEHVEDLRRSVPSENASHHAVINQLNLHLVALTPAANLQRVYYYKLIQQLGTFQGLLDALSILFSFEQNESESFVCTFWKITWHA